MFQGNIYGSPPSGKAGRINYSFGNNLEIKVPSKKDTITGMKKVKIIEDLSFSGSYDIAKDSLNFSYLSVSGRTTLFKNLSVRYSSLWDPYVLDSISNKQLNQFEWDVNNRLFRKNSVSWNFSLSYSLNKIKVPKTQPQNSLRHHLWHQKKKCTIYDRTPKTTSTGQQNGHYR